jgi:hypothetical protein
VLVRAWVGSEKFLLKGVNVFFLVVAKWEARFEVEQKLGQQVEGWTQAPGHDLVVTIG